MGRTDTVVVSRLATGYHGRKGDVIVTQPFDAELYSGELTCLLGPNGAGKSTLLKTLSAFQPSVSGDIYINGRSLADYDDSELARTIGVVLTEKVNVSSMTVRQLVALGRSPYTGFWGSLSGDDAAVVEEAMAAVRIEALSDRMVSTLSDGERQKVMIAKALAQETPVIFLDEPTAFLDYPSKVEIMRLLHGLARQRGITVFMSTHDIELALQMADRLWLIDKMQGVVTGTPEDLSLDGSIARYFDSAGVAFDDSSGSFVIDWNTCTEVCLVGTGPRSAMVRKALLRNGYRCSSQTWCDTVVEVLPDGYLVNGRMCADIAGLLVELYTTVPVNEL